MVNPWILVPLYIYPSGQAWQSLYNTISTNTGTTYRVIINPASGPGSAGSYPDANYIAGIAKLRSYKNTQLLGYVDTAYATRSYSAATSDIDTYAGWSKYSKSDIHMDGIFFDDNPNTDTAKLLTYMTNITTYARKKISGAHVSLNPGTTVSDKWYSMADSIVAYEDTFSDFSTTSINNVKSTQRAKSAFIIYNYSGTSANQQKLVSQLYSAGIPGMFVSTASGYGSFSRYWSAFTGYVASATSSTTTSGTTSNNVKVVNSKRDEAYVKTSSAHSSHATHSSVSSAHSSHASHSTSAHSSHATHSASFSHEVDSKKVFKTVTSHSIVKPTVSPTHPTSKPTSTGSHTASHTASHPQSTHTFAPTSSHTSTHSTGTSPHSSATSTSSAHATHAKKWWPRAWGANAQPIEAI